MKSVSCVRLFAAPWTVAYQAPQSMEFSRQEYWSGLPFPSPISSPTGDQTQIPCVARQILNPWTAREVALWCLLMFRIYYYYCHHHHYFNVIRIINLLTVCVFVSCLRNLILKSIRYLAIFLLEVLFIFSLKKSNWNLFLFMMWGRFNFFQMDNQLFQLQLHLLSSPVVLKI